MTRILLALMLCCLWPSEDALASTPQAKTAPAPAIPDEALQQKIQDKFSKAKAGGGKFQVKVRGGTAYLTGRADVAQHKGSATRMAKSAGAKRVVNNIVVTEAAKQKMARDSSQARPRAATVKSPT